MPVTEILQLVDQLVFKHTGNHLNNLQKNVVQGIWEGKTYADMAKDFGYDSENHIGNVSRELYKMLSSQLGEDVNKSNFCWTLERVINSPHFVGLVNSPVTWCPYHPKNDINKPINDEDKLINNTCYHDLNFAPKITQFYGRDKQLTTLSHWLTNQNSRLISVLGLPGIGKTTLVKQFIDLNLQKFDIIIWKNIKLSPYLDTIITDILKFLNIEFIPTDNNLTQLFNFFRAKKCLIILDDIQEIFTKEEFAGHYKDKYKEYKNFFTKITEIEHQSSLILISQEQCQEMICLDENLYPVKCLELKGLDDTDFLKDWGLKDEESWSKLIDLYAGNPIYLKDIASLIKNVFGGKVSEFLGENSLILTKDIKYSLAELFNRISAIEKQIVLQLGKVDRPLPREDIKKDLSLSSMDLMNGLQSLKQRYLINRIEENQILFDLSPVFKEYVKNDLGNNVNK